MEPQQASDVAEDALRLGHALLTMVEPEPATVAAYNHWYETDHFLSGVLTGPGAFAGKRWVATKRLKDVRFPKASPIASPVGMGSFIATYWIERDQLQAHCDWGFPEAARLAGLGRMRSDRQHVSTAYYDLAGVHRRRDHAVPVELALHHPYDGLVMVWTCGADTTDDHAHARWACDFRARLCADDSPVAQVVSFRPITLPPPLPQMPGAVIGDDPTRDVLAHCCFVDRNLAQSWLTLARELHAGIDTGASAGVNEMLVAPFLPTVAGTDTYLDQLW